jgi:hypothetical protein
MTLQDIMLQTTICNIEKCKKELNDRKIIKNEWLKNSRSVYDDYINKKISKKDLTAKINKLNDDYYKTVENMSIVKCNLKNCYNTIKKLLDYMAAKINYKIKAKYTITDYIKILKLYTILTPEDNIFDRIKCKNDNCANEVRNNKDNSILYLKKINKLYDDYINVKINRKDFIKTLNKLVDDYFNSKEVKNMNKCELDKCSKFIKKKLDYMAININYDIKANYTLDDYINILTITEKILK